MPTRASALSGSCLAAAWAHWHRWLLALQTAFLFLGETPPALHGMPQGWACTAHSLPAWCAAPCAPAPHPSPRPLPHPTGAHRSRQVRSVGAHHRGPGARHAGRPRRRQQRQPPGHRRHQRGGWQRSGGSGRAGGTATGHHRPHLRLSCPEEARSSTRSAPGAACPEAGGWLWPHPALSCRTLGVEVSHRGERGGFLPSAWAAGLTLQPAAAAPAVATRWATMMVHGDASVLCAVHVGARGTGERACALSGHRCV